MKNQLIAWACALLLLMGCKATKDNHAYARVISHPDLAERTYRTLAISHPCVTNVVHSTDSVIIIDTVKDVSDVKKANATIDSLLYKILNNRPDTEYLDIDSLRERIYAEVSKHFKPITITKTITLTDTITDVRVVNQLINDNSVLQGQASELNKQVASLKKANNHKIWYMAGLGLLLLGSIFAYIKKK